MPITKQMIEEAIAEYQKNFDPNRVIFEITLDMAFAAPEMLALLEELEWDIESTAPGAKGWCPVCSNYAEHRADCRLAAVLKKARGE